MKKLMFAFACAASVAAFCADGEISGGGNAVGFDGMLSGATDLGNKTDSGTQQGNMFFAYEPAAGSTDGSIVKTYSTQSNPQPDNLTFDYTKLLPNWFAEDPTNTQYLELSTEGGTLWRGWNATDDGTPERLLTEGVEMDDDSPVYIDTLVQFTPTEDGTEPSVNPVDQMAIWLNVDSSDPDAPVTNLCVLAAQVTESYTGIKTTFKALNKDEGGIDIVPGQWYRLTVKTIADITDGDTIPGFIVYIDGKPIKTDKTTLTQAYLEELGEDGLNVSVTDMMNGSVFASLWMTPESQAENCDPEEPYFNAVGFKGSGAIDDLSLSFDTPNFLEATGSLDFTLTFDANVSAVTYTIGGVDNTVPAADIAAGSYTVEGVEGGTEVTVTATAKDWYVIKSGAGLTAINQADQEIAITTELAATTVAAGASKLEGVDVSKAQAWAAAKGLSIADDIENCDWAKNAFLMNTDLSAEPGLKITAIEETDGGWLITVKGTQGEGAVTLNGINGTLKVKTAASLAGIGTASSAAFDFTLNQDGTATIKVTGDNTNFMKATVE